VTERQHNVRAASILERSYVNEDHDSQRHVTQNRTEDGMIANRSYVGSHRAGSLHLADDQTPARQRGSRGGRHQAEPTDELTGRW
jgi:hypothetical protein